MNISTDLVVAAPGAEPSPASMKGALGTASQPAVSGDRAMAEPGLGDRPAGFRF